MRKRYCVQFRDSFRLIMFAESEFQIKQIRNRTPVLNEMVIMKISIATKKEKEIVPELKNLSPFIKLIPKKKYCVIFQDNTKFIIEAKSKADVRRLKEQEHIMCEIPIKSIIEITNDNASYYIKRNTKLYEPIYA